MRWMNGGMLPGCVIMRGKVRTMDTMRRRSSADGLGPTRPPENSTMGSGGGAYGKCSKKGEGICTVDKDEGCAVASPIDADPMLGFP